MKPGALAASLVMAGLVGLGLGQLAQAWQASPPPPATIVAPSTDVVGYDDVTNLGFTEVYIYNVTTPNGDILCAITEESQHGGGEGIDCDWEATR